MITIEVYLGEDPMRFMTTILFKNDQRNCGTVTLPDRVAEALLEKLGAEKGEDGVLRISL